MDGSDLDPPASARWLPPGTFEDQVALVTGGGTGLGLSISRGLAALGARVTIASRDPAHHGALLEEGTRRGWRVEARALDVREPDAVRRAIDGLAADQGRIDLLVNNAAGNFVCPSERLSANAWRAVLGIVLDGTFYCSRHAGAHMLAAGRGAILNVVATYAWTGMPGVAHSASAKAGVLALTRTLAAEWARRGVRVNAIAPGPFESEGAGRNLWPDEATRARIEDAIPQGRFVDVEEVAAQALHLLSPASSSITGECLVIDGGGSLPTPFWELGSRPRRARGEEGR